MSALYIWGAGGHGRVVCDCAAASGYVPVFLDDDPRVAGLTVAGRPVLSPRSVLRPDSGASFVIAIGQNEARAARYVSALEHGLQAVTLIHPAATVSASAMIGSGTVVMPGAIINAGAQIGSNCIVNSGAIVEHDCRIADHVHIAPRSVLGGGVCIGPRALIGIGATVLPGICIGEGALAGAGAVVTRNLEPGVTAIGSPARPLRVKAA